MKICEAGAKDLWLGRKVKLMMENRVGVICGLNMAIPKVLHVIGGSIYNQQGPRDDTVDIYSISSRVLHRDIFIMSSNIELLDETLDTKDLYDLIKKE